MISRSEIRNLRMLALAACVIGLCTESATAQRDRVRRVARRDSDDLSKFLIESESERRRSTSPSILDRNSGFDASRVDMRAVRLLVTRQADDAARLYQQIDADSARTPSIRGVLSDSLKFRARTAMLAQDIDAIREAARVAARIQELDRDWRLLSHGIKQLPYVSRRVLDIVAALDKTDEQLGRAFKMNPQIDRMELLSQVMAMRADFDNLIDDIELEVGNTAKARELIRRTRSIREHTSYAADLISEHGTYDRIVAAYRRAEEDWRPIAHELAQYNNRYIDRSVRRIVTGANHLKELLWMEQDTDLTQLIEVGNAMRRRVDEFFRRTPLLLLLKLEDKHAAVESAKDFLDACEVYTDAVRENESQDVLIEVFQDLQNTGRSFVAVYQPLPSQSGQLVLQDIRRDLVTLQEMANSHYVGDGFNLPEATRRGAEIQTLAEHLDSDLKHWLRTSNESFANTALRSSAQFVANTTKLYDGLVDRRPREEIRARVSVVYDDWQRINQYLRRAPREDRQHMLSVSAKLTAALYDLMLPLGL